MRKWANGISAGCAAIIGSNVWATVLFVDDTASGANTGDSWDNAYVSLQSALNWPLLSPGDQIWVAAGTYKPGTDVSNAFLMKADVKIWGGFAGGETDPSARNPSANTCILSGFISSGRSHHVFIASGTAIDRDAELDGFTITGGDAAETDNPNGGGMLVLNGSSPTIRRCKFTDNFAECGGGASVQSDPAGPSSNPEFRECVFLANTGGAYGGGVFVSRSAPIFVQCQFIDNTAGSYNPFTQVVTGGNGGGVQIKDVGSAVIFNCMFQNNKCGHVGGGLSMRENVNSVQTLVANCTFVANHCHDSGGGVRVGFGSNARFVNCTFAENYCKETDNEFFHGDGGGLSIGSDHETETGRNVVLDNCIFWNNRLESSTGRGTQSR